LYMLASFSLMCLWAKNLLTLSPSAFILQDAENAWHQSYPLCWWPKPCCSIRMNLACPSSGFIVGAPWPWPSFPTIHTALWIISGEIYAPTPATRRTVSHWWHLHHQHAECPELSLVRSACQPARAGRKTT
jgi:hypothetical protein